MIISVGVVALNEAEYLPQLLDDLINQDYPPENIEIILIDSMSTDETYSIMSQFASRNKQFRRVCILKNKKKLQAPGWNIFLKEVNGDALIRIDAHAALPTDFIIKNVIDLQRGEAVAGGRRPSIIQNKDDIWQNTLLTAENALFGSGIASFRSSNATRYTTSLFHAAYRREVFDEVGYFNENLGRTEDNDIHYRIRKAGYKLFYNPEIISYQYARPTLAKMLRQKFLNGYWIGLTMGIQPKCFSWYHFVPLLFVVAIIIAIVCCSVFSSYPAIMLAVAYGGVNFLMTVTAIREEKFCKEILALPIVFLLLHMFYGMGTLIGLIKMPYWCWRLKKVMA